MLANHLNKPLGLERFYFISRSIFVKDVKYYDQFKNAFSFCFQDFATDNEFKQKILDWLKDANKKELSDKLKSDAQKVFSKDLLKELQKRINMEKWV